MSAPLLLCCNGQKNITMTLPDERYNALKQAKTFLEKLCNIENLVAQDIRERAFSVLRHYPSNFELECIADSCPKYLDKVSFLDKLNTNSKNTLMPNDNSKQLELDLPWPWPQSIDALDDLEDEWQNSDNDFYDSLQDLVKEQLDKLESKKTA